MCDYVLSISWGWGDGLVVNSSTALVKGLGSVPVLTWLFTIIHNSTFRASDFF